jgi:hypothetical protein
LRLGFPRAAEGAAAGTGWPAEPASCSFVGSADEPLGAKNVQKKDRRSTASCPRAGERRACDAPMQYSMVVRSPAFPVENSRISII